jgi:hypothetical protein
MTQLEPIPPGPKPLPFSRVLLLTLAKSLNGPHSRTQKTLDHLRAMEIPAEPFIGFDGEETGLLTTHTYEIDNPGTNYRIGGKTVNMYLGHLMMWRVCEFLEGDSFLFLEDDVRFRPDWREHFDFALPSLPKTWDLLFIGSCCCQGKGARQVSGHLHRVSYALCTHAYAIRKKALRRVQEVCQRIYAGIDIAICLHAIPELETYAFLPRLADQHETDIAP